MNVLYLDTSSKYLSLAVAQDNKVLSQTHRQLARKHSTQLACLIDRILKRAGLSLKEIDGFCVSKGPGSFTGLRIGITAIKGLAYALQKPVVAIPSLDILVQNARPVINRRLSLPLQVCPIVDARQNKVYACLYQARNGKVIRKSGYLLLPIEELLKRLTQPLHVRAGLKGEVLFLGDAIPLYREQIRKAKRIKAVFAGEKFWYPRASRAVSLALERFREGKIDDVDNLAPLYLYPKECQIKKVISRKS